MVVAKATLVALLLFGSRCEYITSLRNNTYKIVEPLTRLLQLPCPYHCTCKDDNVITTCNVTVMLSGYLIFLPLNGYYDNDGRVFDQYHNTVSLTRICTGLCAKDHKMDWNTIKTCDCSR